MPGPLRRTVTLLIALSALAWVVPCAAFQGELSLEIAAPQLHGHHHRPADPHAHHGQPANVHAHHGHADHAEPDATLTPACPCGCDELPAAGGTASAVGVASIPSRESLATSWGAFHPVIADCTLSPSPRGSIDHVPIRA